MKFNKPAENEVMSFINRCYMEADTGRVSLCLKRLEELDREFPDNARIAYATGQIRRDYLGQAAEARSFFARAYSLATSQQMKTETAWFAICNMVGLSPTFEAYRHWAYLAFQLKGKEQPECRMFQEVLEFVAEGTPFLKIVGEACWEKKHSEKLGGAAAMFEVMQEANPDLSAAEELALCKEQFLCLRQLDADAGERRAAAGERFPPEERLALHRAMDILDRAIELDPYEAMFWNFRAAWNHLLERYQDAVAAADEAIKLRPHRYPRPYINKAQSLWALHRDEEALACVKEALCQTKDSGLPPDSALQAQSLIQLYSAGRTAPRLEGLMPLVSQVLNAAYEVSEAEFAQLQRGGVTRETVENRIREHLSFVRANPFKGYVPMIAEVLSCFTPESAAVTTARLLRNREGVPDYCIAAAIYAAVHAEGVHRKDAARYLCLVTLMCGGASAIKQYYRQAFLAVSSAAKDEMSGIESIVREEFRCINEGLSELLVGSDPVTEAERREAASSVLIHFQGEPPCVVIASLGTTGYLRQIVTFFVVACGLAVVWFWLKSVITP